MKLLLTTVLFCLICLVTVSAQTYNTKWREKPGDWYIGFSPSASRYCGDLSERYNFAHLQLSWGVAGLIQYRFDDYLSLRFDLGLTHLRGDQQYTKNKLNNLSFSSINPSASVGLQVNFRSIDYNQHNIPYGWLSVGTIHLDPTTVYKGQQIALADLKTEGVDYARWAGQIAYGVGFPFQVSKYVQLRLEGRYTHVLSDYLDDVSGAYIDKSRMPLLTQQLADRRVELGLPANNIGAQRGDSDNNDGYFLLSLQLIYKR